MTIRIRTIGISLTASSWLLAACKDPLAVRTACIGLGLIAGGTIWPILERGGWTLAGKCRDFIKELDKPAPCTVINEKPAVTGQQYQHDEISEFYSQIVSNNPLINQIQRSVIENILVQLDLHGDCSSVIRKPATTDANNEYDTNTFDILALIPLYKHALDVAKDITHYTTVSTADAMIVALAHDLGKIPQWHNEYPEMPHCELSALILKEIAPTYTALANHTELTSAIIEHHRLIPGTLLGTALKDSNLRVKKNYITENGQNMDLVQSETAGAIA